MFNGPSSPPTEHQVESAREQNRKEIESHPYVVPKPHLLDRVERAVDQTTQALYDKTASAVNMIKSKLGKKPPAV